MSKIKISKQDKIAWAIDDISTDLHSLSDALAGFGYADFRGSRAKFSLKDVRKLHIQILKQLAFVAPDGKTYTKGPERYMTDWMKGASDGIRTENKRGA